MRTFFTAILIASTLVSIGCVGDPAAREASTGSTKLALVSHDATNGAHLYGIYDDDAHSVRLSTEFLGFVRSESVGTPLLVVNGMNYDLDSTDQATLHGELDIGDSVKVIAPMDGGRSMQWVLDIATPDTATDAATKTEFYEECENL